jgi:apolipoprotein D and lipocalin family protein
MGASSSKQKLKAMDLKLDMEGMMGKWYVISCIPTVFEKGAHNAVEKYSWRNEKAQALKVEFNYRTGSFNAKQNIMFQHGHVFNKETCAEWRVSPVLCGCPLPVNLPFLILTVGEKNEAEQYSSVVVGYPDRSYLWIMARAPQIQEDTYADLVERCSTEWGYDTSKIYKVPQQW